MPSGCLLKLVAGGCAAAWLLFGALADAPKDLLRQLSEAEAQGQTKSSQHKNTTNASTEMMSPGGEVGTVLGPVGAWALIFVGVLILCGSGCICGWSICQWVVSGWLRPQCGLCPPGAQDYDLLGPGGHEAKALGPRILGELMLALATPWACLACGIAVRRFVGEGAMGVTIVIVASVTVLRGKAVEVGLLNAHNRLTFSEDPPLTLCGLILHEVSAMRKLQEPVFTLGMTEILDFVSDGFATASAFSLSSTVKYRFTEAWSTGSAASLLGRLACFLGPGGMMAAALAVATWSQLGAAVGTSSPNEIAANCCNIASMGKLGRRFVVGRDTEATISRVLFENAPQLMLQTSLLMAEDCSLFDQPLLLSSVLLSLSTVAAKTVAVTYNLYAIEVASCAQRALGMFVGASLWSLFVYICARLYYIEACPSHEWGITSGCVVI